MHPQPAIATTPPLGGTALPRNLSFSGCGFLGVYQLGVAQMLAEHGHHFMSNIHRFAGASAGALIAATLAVTGTEKIQKCVQFCHKQAMELRGKKICVQHITPHLSTLGPLEQFLWELLPPDGYKIATDRLYVSITSIRTGKSILVSKFESNEELVKCLLASSCVPLMTSIKPVVIGGRAFKTKKFVDGGMRNNLPNFDHQLGRTVSVSPYSGLGKHDICPADEGSRGWAFNINNQDFKVNLPNIIRAFDALFPPRPADLNFYYKRGKRDAENFLKRENFYEVPTTELQYVTYV